MDGWIEGGVVSRAPADGEELARFLDEAVGVRVPGRARLDGHHGPGTYVEHVFFERAGDPVVWACRGGGKTFLGAVATMLDLVFKPGVEVRILGGSLQQSGRMHAHLRWLFGKPALGPLVSRMTGSRVEMFNGSVCELLAQSQTAVRGTRVQKLRCDEVELFHPEVWSAAQLTTRSVTLDVPGWGETRVRGSVEALSTMHVPYGLMSRLVEEAASGPRRLFRWGVLDVLERCGDAQACRSESGDCALWGDCGGRAKDESQTGHVRIEDALTQIGRVDRGAWESEMLCARPSRLGTVLPEFDAKTHVVSRVPDAAREGVWLCGMDFGFRSPTVVLWAVQSGDVLYVVDEHVRREMVIASHIEAVRARPWPEPAWVGVDPAGRQRSDQTGVGVSDVLRSEGFVVRDRRVPLVKGLLALRARLSPASGAPTMFVHERCAELIRSLETYHYPDDDERSLVPIKDGSDHAVDALRYLVQNLDLPYRCARGRYV